MTEFNQVFDGDLAERVFIVGSLIFVALYACGIFLQRPIEVGMRRTALYGRTAVTALVLAAAVSVTMGGLGLFNTPTRAADNSPVTISIDELQRSIDTQSLPVEQVENPV